MLIVHHSASSRDSTIADIDRWHRERGFEGIGYHYVIEADGALRYGRHPGRQGAHDLGENEDSLGVCVTGHGHAWSVRQEEALLRLMRACRVIYGPGFDFSMHRENEPAHTHTECPGITDARWAEFLAALRERP